MTTTTKKYSSPRLQKSTPILCGWPSDSFSVDYSCSNDRKDPASELPDIPHTVIVFIPGNPGLIEWYLSFFVQLIQRLGPGYAARGVANAGHSLDTERVHVAQWKGPSSSRCTAIPWTVEGQSRHKAAYMDFIIQEFQDLIKLHGVSSSYSTPSQPKFIFVCHSIGTFFTQQLLMRRRDILTQTQLLIGLMPFIRMDAPWEKQILFNTLAAYPSTTIRVHETLSWVLSKLPQSWIDLVMRSIVPNNDDNDNHSRAIAVALVCSIPFVENFFTLGLEEIRDVPETVNVGPLRQCPTVLLLAGNDHWSPKHHLNDLQRLREQKWIPDTVQWEYNPNLRHDFIVDPKQVAVALDFCETHIIRQRMMMVQPTSKL